MSQTLTFLWPTHDLLTMNAERRMHHQQRAKLVKAIRVEVTAACADMTPLSGRVNVTARFRWADKRRRDTSNAFPTVKAAVDALVAAGVLPHGDDDRWVGDTTIGADLPPNPKLKGYAQMTLTIEETT